MKAIENKGPERICIKDLTISLYERSQGEFNAFFSLAFRRYVDTKKLRDMQAAAIQKMLLRRLCTPMNMAEGHLEFVAMEEAN
jgi:hypothetical protein